jgi:hypothetical protein
METSMSLTSFFTSKKNTEGGITPTDQGLYEQASEGFSKEVSRAQETLEDLKIPARLENSYHAARQYLSSWVEQAGSYDSEKVMQIISPLRQTVSTYLKKGEGAFDKVLQVGKETEEVLLKIIGKEDLPDDKKPSGMIRLVLEDVKETLRFSVNKSLETLEKVSDYLGTKILGDVLYKSMKDTFLHYGSQIGAFIVNTVRSALDALFKNEKKAEEKKLEKRKQSQEKLYSVEEVKELEKAKAHVGDLLREVSYFNTSDTPYLAKNILDKEEDGILKNRPDQIRQDLTKISRPVFDPFPSAEVREERELTRKAKT